MKTCIKCSQAKEINEFYINTDRAGRKTSRSSCKDCSKKRNREYAIQNPEKVRESCNRWYKNNPDKAAIKHSKIKEKKYGVTPAQFTEMMVSQNSKCSICKLEPNDGRSLCIDHCHKTGQVRGLLCSKCNQALGLFKDDKFILQEAISYLTKPYNKSLRQDVRGATFKDENVKSVLGYKATRRNH